VFTKYGDFVNLFRLLKFSGKCIYRSDVAKVDDWKAVGENNQYSNCALDFYRLLERVSMGNHLCGKMANGMREVLTRREPMD